MPLGVHNDKGLIEEKELHDFKAYISRVAGIKEVLARDHMKVSTPPVTSRSCKIVLSSQ